MGLINTLVNFPDDLFIRVQLRGELIALNINHMIDELRLVVDEKVDIQVDLYVNEAAADLEAMEDTDYDLQNPSDLIQLIERNIEGTDFHGPFVAVLQKLLLVSNDEFVGTVMWSKIEEEVFYRVTTKYPNCLGSSGGDLIPGAQSCDQRHLRRRR